MLKKLRVVWLLLLVAMLCAVTMTACEQTKLTPEEALRQLDGFTVPADETRQVGSEFMVTKIVAFDAEGNEYVATVSVTYEGEEVLVENGKVRLARVGTYLVKYTITYKEVSIIKSFKITVEDKSKPQIVFYADTSKHKVGEEMTIPVYEVFDDGAIVAETVKIYDEAGAEVDGLKGTKFTPAQKGRYRMAVTVTDDSGNTETGETYFFAAAPAAEYDVLEDFEYGFEPDFMTVSDGAFKFQFEDGNAYVSTSLNTFWPDVTFKQEAVAAYAKKGYDKLHIRLWGTNTKSRTFYYGIKDKYKYGNLQPGVATDLYIDKADLDQTLAEGALKITFFNDTDNETFTLNVDDIYGVYNGQKLVQGKKYAVSSLYDISDKVGGFSGYKVYYNKENLGGGTADNHFTPDNDGIYTLAYTLQNNKGSVRIPYTVITSVLKFGFEDGRIPSLMEFTAGSVSVSTQHATEGVKSLKWELSAGDGYPTIQFSKVYLGYVFADESVQSFKFDLYSACSKTHGSYVDFNYNNNGNYARTELKPGAAHTITMTREDYLSKQDGTTIGYTITNDGDSNEAITVYLDNFRAEKSLANQTLYISQGTQADCTLAVDGAVTVLMNGTDVTANAELTAAQVKLPYALLKEFEGVNTVTVLTSGATYNGQIGIIGKTIGFENGLSPAISVRDGSISGSGDHATVGAKSLKWDIGSGDGYPLLKISKDYLNFVFSDATVNSVCFDLTSTGANTHGSYLDFSGGLYVRADLQSGKTVTMTITREDYAKKKDDQDKTLDYTILNDVASETFSVYIDNFRPVKSLEDVTLYQSQAMQDHFVELAGVTAIRVNGADVTGTADFAITADGVTISAAWLKANGGEKKLEMATDDVSYMQKLTILNSVISFEDGTIPSVLTSDQCSMAITDVKPTDGSKSLRLAVGANDGLPKLLVDMSYFDALFANSSVTGFTFDVFLDGKFAHPVKVNDSAETTIGTVPSKTDASPVTLSRAIYQSIKDSGKSSIAFIFHNMGSESYFEGAEFWIYLDNFRPVVA